MSKQDIEKMKAKRDVEGLMEALKDEYWRVGRYAAKALGNIEDSRAIEPLMEALNDGNSGVEKEAARALKKIRAKKS